MRALFFLFLAAGISARAQDSETEGEAPAILITSPDTATTFAFGSIKQHSLIWDKKSGELFARIVFEDEDRDGTQINEDTHFFRLPGVSFDAAHGIFNATSATGEVIPVARIRHELFLSVISTLPNAVVRIQHPHGVVNVVLEALKPDDPALRAPHPATANGQSIEVPGLTR